MVAAGRRGGGGEGRRPRGGFGKGPKGGRRQYVPPGAQRGGIAGVCVCPSCGTTVPHERGIPCTGIACPQCGKPMARK